MTPSSPAPTTPLALTALRHYHLDTPVRRAWPAKNGALVFETVDGAGRLRAGNVTADGTVSLLAFGSDKKLPELAEDTDAGAHLLVHRAGKRAVTRSSDRVTKHLRAGKTAAVARLSTDMGAVFERAGFAAARVLEVRETSLDFSLLPGRTLLEHGEASLPGWQVFAQNWLNFLTTTGKLTQADGQGTGTYPVHDAAAETRVLDHWLEQVRTYAALDRAQELSDAARAVSTALAGKPDPAVLLHRDLHDKQLLWDGVHLGVLDVDTAATGEAALDLGNLLVHIELRRVQGYLSKETAETITVLLQDLAQSAGISCGRLGAYTQVSRIRIACVYAFRPSSTPWLENWITHTLTHTP